MYHYCSHPKLIVYCMQTLSLNISSDFRTKQIFYLNMKLVCTFALIIDKKYMFVKFRY